MELLRGVRAHESKHLLELLAAVSYAEIERIDFTHAGEELCRLREKGKTVPATDAVIAAMCKRMGLALLTLDEHCKSFPGVNLLKPGKTKAKG